MPALPAGADFDRFVHRFRPSLMRRVLLDVVEDRTRRAADFAAARWRRGGYATAQGTVRRQDIFEGLGELYEPGCHVETFDYNGFRLVGDERRPNFSVLISGNDTALLIARLSDRFERPPSRVARYFAVRNEPAPLFADEFLYGMGDLGSLECLFICGYDLDPEVPYGSAVGGARILAPRMHGKIHRLEPVVPDLREYIVRPDPVAITPLHAPDAEPMVRLRPHVALPTAEVTNEAIEDAARPEGPDID